MTEIRREIINDIAVTKMGSNFTKDLKMFSASAREPQVKKSVQEQTDYMYKRPLCCLD